MGYEIVGFLIEKCPHCGAKHVDTSSPAVATGPGQPGIEWRILVCNNPECRKMVLAEHDNGKFVRIYPAGSFDIDEKLRISQAVRREFKEAGQCLVAGCFLASMTMSRRVLQRCLKEHGFDQRQLADQIDAAKLNGTIPKRYHSLADEIRVFGNIGAHPDEDQAINANRENAEQILGFLELLIEEFYVLPQKAERLRHQREETKTQKS